MRRQHLVMLLVVVVVITACVARRAGLSRDALESDYEVAAAEVLPTIADLLRARVPLAAVAPVIRSDLRGTNAAIAFALGADVDDDALACVRADVRRDYPAVLQRCLRFAVAHPQDARTPAVIRIVARHLGSLPVAGRAIVLEQTAGLVAACASARARHGGLSCADLAIIVDDARRAAADDDASRALVASRPLYMQKGSADGPWLDGDEHFSTSPFARVPRKKHAGFRVFDVVDRSDSGAGTLVPSHRGLDGWWRVTVQGESKASDVVLAVKAWGPLEIQVDGVSVLVRENGAVGAELERIPLRLQAGLHTVEVLCFERGSGVSIALVDADGTAALGSSEKQPNARPAGFSRRDDNDGVVQALALAPAADASNADQLVTLIFRHVLARAGHGQTVDDERVLARLLLQHWSWSPPALVIAAQSIEDDALPERFKATLAATVWDRLLTMWPDNPVALLARARLAAEANPEQALPAWRAIVAARPDYAIGHRELIDALLERQVVDEALVSAEALLKLGATADNIAAAIPALRAVGQNSRAARLADQQAQRTTDQRSRRALVKGETASVRAELKNRLIDGDDDLIERWLDLAEGDGVADALRLLDAVIAQHPDDAGLRLRRARLVVLAGGAPPSLSGSVDLDALVWREALGLSVPWSARKAKGDEVIAARRRSPEPWPGFATVFLQDDLERRFAPDGTSLVIRHWIAELRSKEALDAFGELSPSSGERLLRLRVVKSDGRIVEPEHHDNVDDISLPQLAAGDIVEWLSASADSALCGGGFWELRSLVQSTPAVTRSYSVSIPTSLSERLPIALMHTNGAPAPVQTTAIDDGVETTTSLFTMSGPPLLNEPFTVEDEEAEPEVGIVVNVGDPFFRRSRRGELAGRTRIDPWLKSAALEIAGRGSAPSQLQRIFRFVADKITPQATPVDAIGVLATGTGRRLPLFTALATAAGLDVHVLAVHPPLGVPLPLPHRTSFGSLVVSVVVDGQVHVAWFDEATALLDRVPASFAGALTLDLATGAKGMLSNDVIDTSATKIQIELTLGDDDVLRGFMALRLPAALAEAVRPSLRQATPEMLAQGLEGALAASFPGVKVERVTLPGLETVGGPLAFVGDIEVPVSSSGTMRFEHLFAGGAAAAFRLGTPLSALVRIADRKRPLRVMPESEELVVRVRLPARASFVELPESADLAAGPVHLKQHASVEDGTLLWERSIQSSTARVSVEEWPAMRAALALMLSRADARVAFVAALPTSSPAAAP